MTKTTITRDEFVSKLFSGEWDHLSASVFREAYEIVDEPDPVHEVTRTISQDDHEHDEYIAGHVDEALIQALAHTLGDDEGEG